jgi:hypothetical protein
MVNYIGSVCITETLGSSDDRTFQPGECRVDCLDTAQAGQLEAPKEVIAKWADDDDLSAVRAIVSE